MAIVVSDTSPIRALTHLGLIEILRELYVEVLIPPAVEDERRNPASGSAEVDVSAFPFIRIQAPADLERVDGFRRTLDGGESEAIVLALEVQAKLILMDEAAGRAVAEELGLIPVGVLGPLVRAKARGLIGEVAPMIDRLENELRFFVSARVRGIILRSAGE